MTAGKAMANGQLTSLAGVKLSMLFIFGQSCRAPQVKDGQVKQKQGFFALCGRLTRMFQSPAHH